jgi:hypothetical protein
VRPGVQRTRRLEAFSDGVLAIPITLLALVLAAPASSELHALSAVVVDWPGFLADCASVATVGVPWHVHNAITEYHQRADGVFIRLNLPLLLVVAFLPCPTRPRAERILAGGRAARDHRPRAPTRSSRGAAVDLAAERGRARLVHHEGDEPSARNSRNGSRPG